MPSSHECSWTEVLTPRRCSAEGRATMDLRNAPAQMPLPKNGWKNVGGCLLKIKSINGTSRSFRGYFMRCDASRPYMCCHMDKTSGAIRGGVPIISYHINWTYMSFKSAIFSSASGFFYWPEVLVKSSLHKDEKKVGGNKNGQSQHWGGRIG